jgi:hypothetical protein
LFFAALASTAVSHVAAFALERSARSAPKFLSAKPDQAEGAKVLESFRNVGIQGSYWLQFDLRVMPRRGAERILKGEMFGMPGPNGPLTKLITIDLANEGGSRTQLWMLHGGPEPTAWEWNAGQRGMTPRRMSPDRWLEPLEETDLTLFDLQMPFLRWTDFVYEGVANVRGRPAHAFLLYPPRPLSGAKIVPAAVRVFLDTQFGAMTQAEWLSAEGKPLKTVTVLDLKKTGDQWIVKSIDLRNHVTRGKTRFAATAVATGLSLPERMFAPEHISRGNPEVPATRIERL